MNPGEFAQKHLYPYKVKGNEIIPERCPYCGGGEHGDKYTFALNTDKLTYNCKRGKCNVSGTFSKLCSDFGETADKQKNFEINYKIRRNFKKPKTEVKQPSSKVEQYLQIRGFSKDTWERHGVGDDRKGNIVFPYYENGELVMLKFRPARKIKKGERKGWREKGGKPVFFGMDLCNTSKPLTIVEGEMDCLALDEAGIENVVSVPSGSSDLTCIDLCWDWLQQFKKIIIWVDNDEPGKELQRNLINRLGAWRCWVVNSERKDANEVLFIDGKEKVVELYNSAVEVPINGLIRLADVKPFDYSKSTRIKSGIRGLDTTLGGFMMGQFTIWTGVNSSGKSTLLGQVLLDAVDQGFSVCAYSGELPAPVFRYWIDIQAAGPNNLEMKYDSIKESEVAYPKKEVINLIREWYRDKFFLYDSYGTTTDKNLFEVFEYAVKRYGCKVFSIDNLMTTCFETNESDYYRRQTEFINKVAEFAQRFDVHVHLVAHPRKTKDGVTKMDVAGSGNITNRADNVLNVQRLKEDEQEKEQCHALLQILKNRFLGKQDIDIQLNFDDKCKRFYMASEPGAYKQYSWINQLPEDDGLPFE